MRQICAAGCYSGAGVAMHRKVLEQVNKHFNAGGLPRGRGGWMLTPEGTIAVSFAIIALACLAWVLIG